MSTGDFYLLSIEKVLFDDVSFVLETLLLSVSLLSRAIFHMFLNNGVIFGLGVH